MTLATPVPATTYNAFGNIATGTFTGDGTTTVIPVAIGFTPVYVKLIEVAATTGSQLYEWIQGMAATDTILTTGAVDPVIDSNSAVLTNGITVSTTETGVYAPGTQEPNDGSLINTTVGVYGIDKTKSYQLQFTIPGSNSGTWVWLAIG
jgi:hypothetical protein